MATASRPESATPTSATVGPAFAEVARSPIAGRFVLGAAADADDGSTEPFDGDSAPPPSPDLTATDPSSSSGLSATADSDRRYAHAIARIGSQLADALAYVHERVLVRCDVKPSNLLLDLKGKAWVAEFGSAKVSGDADLSHTGDLIGTLRYMAPGRFRGECDARADVYALGLTLLELLALRPAFDARDRVSLIRQVTEGASHPLRRLNPMAPRDLETIGHQAIAHEPSVRYATAHELTDDL